MKITPDKILFFDLDGTLIDTDYANFVAYNEAITEVFNQRNLVEYNPTIRFDKTKLRNVIWRFYEEGHEDVFYSVRNYTHVENNIVLKKQKIYPKKLGFTKKIDENMSVWRRFVKTNKVILVSNCSKKRGLETIKYHKLYFHKTFFLEDKTLSENKYENAIKSLGINPKDVITFEDNDDEIKKAKQVGIQCVNPRVDGEDIKEIFGGIFKNSTFTTLIYQNEQRKIRLEIENTLFRDILENKENYQLYIDENPYPFSSGSVGKRYKILRDGLKEFTIKPNNFLRQEVRAFYHKDYFSGGNWNIEGKIEHLIWSIKNDEGCKDSHRIYLSTACKRLKNILNNDIPEIKKRIGLDSQLTICVVPRAKEGYLYEKNQLLFRQTVFDTLSELREDFIDGTKYIVRHTSTKTTHFGNNDDKGNSPYVGITKDTCYISDNVIGKNILLIDDVYTKTVNVDEDAIQALLDKGAQNVYFYAVGKTYSYR